MPRIVSTLLLLFLAIAPSAAGARGLHAGEFGLFPRDRQMGGRRAGQPGAYVAVDLSVVADQKALQDVTAGLGDDLSGFRGRMIVDDASPAFLDGAASGAFILIAFGSLQDARNWTQSPGFKDFEARSRKAATARIFVVNGLAGASPADAANDHREEHERAFERIVKERDKSLSETKDICTGC